MSQSKRRERIATTILAAIAGAGRTFYDQSGPVLEVDEVTRAVAWADALIKALDKR